MRLLALDLARYGPFTGRRLTFRPDARLHVVVGPNEAGKSCALAAVTDVLFGIEERTRYDFLHRDEGIRLGAEIEARDGGRRLAFFRRKGRKNLLSDPAGGAIPDDALAPFLGGLGRSVFCNAFGLNAEVLRAGGREMLRADGEVGATLFAAASGLRGYRDTARDLDDEAAQIYTPRAQKRLLTQAIDRYKDHHKAVGTERIGAEAWRDLNAQLDAAVARLAEIAGRRGGIAVETARLQRLQRVTPLLHGLDGLAAAQSRFADLVPMEDDAVEEVGRRHRADLAARERLAEAEAAFARAERDLASLSTDPALAPHQDGIRRLIQGVADYESKVRDLPRVRTEQEGFARDLAEIAIRVGLADAESVAAAQPTDLVRVRVAALIEEGREVQADLGRVGRELEARRRDLASLLAARRERGPLVDPASIREDFEAIAPVLRETSRRDEAAAELRRDTQALDGLVRRLSPAIASADALASLPLPSAETIRRFGSDLDAASRRRERALDQRHAARTAERAVADRIASRRADGPVPDRATLLALRAERDEAWHGVRAAAFGEAGAPGGAALAATVARAERGLQAADRLADLFAVEAERAAEHASDLRRLPTLRDEVSAADAALAGTEATAAKADADWIALWQSTGIVPHPPSDMAEWLATASGLVERHGALARRRVDLALVVERIEAVRPALVALAERLGLTTLAGLDLALATDRVAERLRGLSETWDAARDGETRIRTTEEAVAAADAALATARERETGWRLRWEAGVAALNLPAETRIEEAGAALEAWGQVPGLLREQGNRRARVEGIRRDLALYEAEVDRIVRAVSPGTEMPVLDAATWLGTRAEAAREAEIRRDALAKTVAAAARLRDEAALGAEQAGRTLAELLTRSAVPAGTDLEPLLARLRERSGLEADIRQVEAELSRSGDGLDREALRRELDEAGPPDAIVGRLFLLGEEEARLDQEGREVYAKQEELARRRREIEGGVGAELSAARKRAAEAEIRETARRYVVLKLGALLLGNAVERHRAGQQDPLLRRAGEIFAGLTGGNFAALAQSFDDADQPHLRGQRAAGGRSVGVDEMSEGTRDQLFLALRLAYLEDFARRSEPSPFVGDDIFATFDDARTGHGLEALASIGHDLQPILFTHHEQVASLARERLGDAVDVIDLG
ncbi:AAA family ATPase [uncultured Enterovirga sp.]|uniref:AAA family ATPase n=1 Tax=uncultured Enterovirga sp. TaxID=2026352 RepID=UPI0035C9E0C4